jgi:hypothetical protein
MDNPVDLMKRGVEIFMLENLTGYIYFIQMDRIGPIKIGLSRDIGKRLYQLHSGSPYPLRLLGFVPGNEDMEKRIHHNFDYIRLEGEWFLPHPLLLKSIKETNKYRIEDGCDNPIPALDLVDWTKPSQGPLHDKVTQCLDRYCEIIKRRTTRLCLQRGCNWLKSEQIKGVGL